MFGLPWLTPSWVRFWILQESMFPRKINPLYNKTITTIDTAWDFIPDLVVVES
jgi:hypothetical protein